MQTMQLSCIKISTISEQTKSILHLSVFNYEYHQVRLNGSLAYGALGVNHEHIFYQN